MDPDLEILKKMLGYLRVYDLQAVLVFAGKPKTGLKEALHQRCLELLPSRTPELVEIIKDVYDSYRSQNCGSRSLPLLSSQLSGTSSTGGRSGTCLEGHADSGVDCGVEGQGQVSPIIVPSQSTQSGPFRAGERLELPSLPFVFSLEGLPFYDMHSVLLGPTVIDSGTLSFSFKPSEEAEVRASKNREILLRCRRIDERTKLARDWFPIGLLATVNGRSLTLLDWLAYTPREILSRDESEDTMKQRFRPINIRQFCVFSSFLQNTITLRDNSNGKNGCCSIAVYIAEKVSADDLFNRISQKILPMEFTKELIRKATADKNDDDDDDDIQAIVQSAQVSLICPLGQSKMKYPCRSQKCQHLQCFDLKGFLQINEKGRKFTCPICGQGLNRDDLRLDSYFQKVIQDLGSRAVNEIRIQSDGSWEPVKETVEAAAAATSEELLETEIVMSNLMDSILILDDSAISEEVEATSVSGSSSTSGSRPETRRVSSEDEGISLGGVVSGRDLMGRNLGVPGQGSRKPIEVITIE